MTRELLMLIFGIFTTVSFAQGQTIPMSTNQKQQVTENANYQLFPTKNFWTFLKLDTRNGKMWQVHFSLNNDNDNGEIILNSLPLVSKEEEIKGRFTLYPTENIYNFLLLDQIDGTVVQVQWSKELDKRGIVSIIKPID